MINKTNTDCETTLCYYETATRPYFFHGMLLTDEHLRAEQDYHRDALKRLNRHLWGSGIVCGLTVDVKNLCLTINPGVALDCCGDLIEVCKCITVDLSKECEKTFGPDCPPAQLQPNSQPYEIKKYLVLRYMERPIDLQPVLTPDTDCDPAGGKSKCSPSKIQEGFCVELWDRCPCPQKDVDEKDLMTTLREAAAHQESSYQPRPVQYYGQGIGTAAGAGSQGPGQGPPAPPAPEKYCINLAMPCTECGCCESAVGIAELTINCTEKTIKIVECSCRRYVISPRLLSWLFSKLKPKDMPAEMTDMYTRMGDQTSANLVMAGVNHQSYGERLTELERSVTEPNRKGAVASYSGGGTKTRSGSKRSSKP